jgi:antitoxin ParD1/3/4
VTALVRCYRRDQESIKFSTLRDAIQEGLDSGISDRSVPQIMAEVKGRLKTSD